MERGRLAGVRIEHVRATAFEETVMQQRRILFSAPRCGWFCSALAVVLLVANASADEPKKAQGRANRLAKETSPYLLLHAHNPVDWYPWGPEAFAKAKAEDKPIFLSVGYSSCYWCHVMERECFQDAEIAKLMNEKFVCVKVDREERPDVDQIYMSALQALSNGGGWPMSMFLTPDGRPFYGGTYFPPRERDGIPAFPAVLRGVSEAWRDQRKEVDKAANELTEIVKRANSSAAARRKVALSRDMLIECRARLAEQFDPDFGGFGYDPDATRRPKFPEPSNLVFLLDQNRRTPANPVARRLNTDPRLKGPDPLAMVLTSLDHMARGGIRDHLAGGYHRYSVNRSWTVPHFEKMLYDNAQLASVLIEAFETTHDLRWRREAESIFAFVARSLTSPEGGFYSALDAETEGDEGGYYVWTRDEVERILKDAKDSDLFARVYGLDRMPNFEKDRYVLFRPRGIKEQAEALETTPEVLEQKLAPMRAKLLAVRDKRPAPLLDDKVLTSWNGLMIAAYADGYRVFKDDAYRQAAEKAADFLLARLRTPDGRLLRTYRAGQAKLGAYLEDYAFLIHGLLRLHAATGDKARLAQARELTDRMLAEFTDKKDGGFFYTADGHETLLARTKDPYDSAIPSGNSVAIRSLIALSTATGEARYLEEAGKALDAFSPIMGQSPVGVPLMLVGLGEYLDARPADGATQKGAARTDPLGLSSDNVVTAKAEVAREARVTPGGEVSIKVTVTTKPGWHIYANPVSSETLKPTVVNLTTNEAANLGGVEYPQGTKKALAGQDEKVGVYEGSVVVNAQVRIDKSTKPGPLDLELKVRYQACDDRACLAPASLTLPLHLEVVAP
jgi:uncharacterized protein YyaL (SSP411 family)